MKTKLIHKVLDGIKYFSDKQDPTGLYRLWESNSHPKYKHWAQIKKASTNP